MSIEQDIKRIADALEKLTCPGANQVAESPVGQIATPLDVPPGMESEGPTAGIPGPISVNNPTELRDFAQKCLQASGDKAPDFVKYIKENICQKFSPKEPKLIKIPDNKLAQAAKMIYDYALKQGISVE